MWRQQKQSVTGGQTDRPKTDKMIPMTHFASKASQKYFSVQAACTKYEL